VIEPLRIEFTVGCPPAHAFAVWTDHIDTWWPRSHTVSGDPERVVLEPRVGGRLFERTADGEIAWGEITYWDPPHRFGSLWHMRRDRADATDVAITFTPTDDEGTRVMIVHDGWERLGSDGPTWRDANRGGWDGLLPHFVAACPQRDKETR
jgi:Activator of Hsp90 ATPase homolog 1-like protein